MSFFADVTDTPIEDLEDDKIPTDEKPFDTIHRRDPERPFIPVSKTPPAEYQIKESPINLLGRTIKYYALCLMIQVASNLMVTLMRISVWDDEDESKNIESYRHFLTVAKALRYKGRALSLPDLTAEELLQQLQPDFEGKNAIRGAINVQIKNGDEVVSEKRYVGDDDGNIHIVDEEGNETPIMKDGKYKGYKIENGELSGTNKKQTRIEIPSGVTAIADEAFKEYKNLTEVIIPDSVTHIGSNAFDGCSKLTSINLPKKLRYIDGFMFNECKSLTRLEIPKGVEWIGMYAFSDCEKLETVIIPESVNAIYGNAFMNCKSLRKVMLPEGLTEISVSLFDGCEKLESVNIPDSVTEIQGSAFSDCGKLKKISIPKNVTSIGWAAFANCKSLTSIDLPEGFAEINASLFRGCEKLTAIDIPDSVETIGDMAFDGCSALTEVFIPDSVKAIGDYAFDDCDSLKTVSAPGKDVEVGTDAFPKTAEVKYRLDSGRTTTRKPAKTSKKGIEPKEKTGPDLDESGRYTLVTPDDEIYTHYGKLKREHDKWTGMGIRHESNNGTEHEAIPLTALMERKGKTDSTLYKSLKAIEANDKYDLKESALKIAQVFRVDESVFNARHDDEGEIGVTMLDKKYKLSALRSFAWTLADLADREEKSIDDYDEEELSGICGFIEKRAWLNYEAGSWFDGLCGHPDIHVYYMPQKLIDDGSAETICDIFNYNPIVSLDTFRNDLALLKNSMIRLHNKLLKNRDRNEKLDSAEAAVLKAWCSMVMSAETSFFSEDGPMMFFHDKPETPLNTKPLSVGTKAPKLKKAASKAKKADASSVMDTVASYEIICGPDGKNRVKLGEYPAGTSISWLVLENNGKNMLLLSEFGLDAKAFNDMRYTYNKTGSFGDSTNEWHNCSLRQWLNDEFYNEAFTQDEKDMILDDTHDTYKMSSRGEIEETAEVTDKVFLLTAREIKKYFPTQRDMICKATKFAKEQGAEIEGGPMQCHWWCRSPAVELMPGLPQWVGCIMADGNGKGWGNTADGVCVRPVIRIKADKIKNVSQTSVSATTTISPNVSSTPVASRTATEAQVEEIKANAAKIIDNVHTDIESTKSALEKHAENLRKQEEEKEKRMQEAKAKGKSDKDEDDMLAVLLIEEDQGNLNRSEEEFVEIYAEDFGAYNEAQLKKLRKKVLPKIHDKDFIAAAKEEMLSRPVKDRFSISTGNWFNLSNHWNFDEKGEMAIEKTKFWYHDSELDEARSLMENHKKEGCASVNRQLSSFNESWINFNGVKNDLHIDISETDEEVSPKHSLFDVKLSPKLRVQINLRHPSMGFIVIPVMNLFASVWNVTPEKIWEAAMNNSMDDARGVDGRTRSDAISAKVKALEQIKPATQKSAVRPAPESVNKATGDQQQRDHILAQISQLEKEREEAKGLFAGMKKKKIQRQIDELKEELRKYL